MTLKCIKGKRGIFRKGKVYKLEKYPVEDYYFTAIEDDKGALIIVSMEDKEDVKWVNKYFIKVA